MEENFFYLKSSKGAPSVGYDYGTVRSTGSMSYSNGLVEENMFVGTERRQILRGERLLCSGLG